MHSIKEFWTLIKNSFQKWNDKDAFNKSVIISFYAIFSLPGLLVIVINVAGSFYDKKDITDQIVNQVQIMIGNDTAGDVEAIIGNASQSEGNTLASALGIATLLFGATGVFYHIQRMLNEIWEVKPKVETRQKILAILKDRLFSFGIILAVGFLLLVSLVISAVLSAVSSWVTSHFSETFNILFKFLDILISLGFITFLFAAIFRFLPDAKVRWKDVWWGALLTAILFVIAKFGLGLYFGKSDPGSTYGAAGSVILIMLWVSYVGLILLYGAEFTHEYIGRKTHRRITPKPTAMSTVPAKE